ncbi:solute carrier family 22 member 23 isoform X3 [Ochotona curzoniae]|uniref:solute carrier family 22 member 23 isoform X3 n=1 Tax=Ochotona curzoniae TaxID=130825 RepID=UPI001B349869|nr:solute carrier family 22 member 23 isoform X3 [Ochotona curzoniae]XP_040853307.1 solute carrier family 22 member 23 isoform X3 [Ochotona curzoniae]
MAIDRRRDAAGGGPGRQLPPTEENGSLPPGDAAASAPLGGRAGSGGGSGEIQPLPALPPGGGGGPHPGCCSAAAAPSLLLLDYDGSVLPFLGGLGGGYQRTLVLLTWIPALFIGFTQFSDSFLLDQPNFWCRGAGKGSELAGTTLGGPWGEPGNWTSPAPTPFSATAWGATRNASGHGGAEEGDTPPLPSPPDKGDNASNCDCRAWDYGIRTGLVQNVVSKGWPAACTTVFHHLYSDFWTDGGPVGECDDVQHTQVLRRILPGWNNSHLVCITNRAVPAGKAVHDHHGGELRDHGGPVPHARPGRPVPGLAGAASPHHLPLPAHAALLVDIPRVSPLAHGNPAV